MKQVASLLLALTLFTLNTFSQILEPIKWKAEIKESEQQIVFTAAIESGWHLYGMNLPEGGPVATSFKFDKLKGVSLVGAPEAKSAAITKKDETFGLVLTWYEKQAKFIQKIKITDKSGYLIEGYINFMGCNDESCLPPSDFGFSFKGKGETAGSSANSKPAETPQIAGQIKELETTGSTVPANIKPENAVKDTVPAVNTQTAVISNESPEKNPLWTPVIDELKQMGSINNVADTSWWFLLISGFIGGLLALLTPCVWPIIPMTVSFFLKRNKNSKKAIKEAVQYGLSIIVIYLLLGLGITLIFGASSLNSLATNAIFNLLFFALLVVFAISFFGAFELVLPSKWANKIDSKADSTSGLLSIFFMAFTLSLVSFSCTGPIIGTLLVQAATMNSLIGPAIGMFGFALALAIPFTLFAIFPNWLQKLPKSGGWLNTVKVVLGFLELAFALKFFSVADLAYGWGLLDRETFLALWIVIFGLLGFYLLGKIKLPHDSELKHVSVTRLFMAMISLAFAIYMIPGLWGAPLKAISAFSPPASTQDFNLYDNEVHPAFTDYEAGMAASAISGKPVMIDFSGYGCVNCRKMENSVWQDPEVKDLLENKYILITLMVDDKTPLKETIEINENGKTRKLRTVGDKWSYLQRHKFGANAQPYYILLNAQGKPLAPSYSYNEDIDKYIKFLKSGL
jgi:thiol:disulfide interchange protein DsbD